MYKTCTKHTSRSINTPVQNGKRKNSADFIVFESGRAMGTLSRLDSTQLVTLQKMFRTPVPVELSWVGSGSGDSPLLSLKMGLRYYDMPTSKSGVRVYLELPRNYIAYFRWLFVHYIAYISDHIGLTCTTVEHDLCSGAVYTQPAVIIHNYAQHVWLRHWPEYRLCTTDGRSLHRSDKFIRSVVAF